MNRRALVFLAAPLLLAFAGACARTSSTAVRPLAPEAQSELDRLNAQCASEPWRSEVDLLERPETLPPGRMISGEVRAFVSDCKERLARHGVRVRWNPDRKLFEVE
ncbi:MAG: hypothetical protein JXR96_05665 [Deltaproteobacteria bacterium]|nr:hypothetical protein [Deltaproteobacteria bacterium]